jgi:hypothetical protein
MSNYYEMVLKDLELKGTELDFGTVRTLLHEMKPTRGNFKKLQYVLDLIAQRDPIRYTAEVHGYAHALLDRRWSDGVRILERNFKTSEVEHLAKSVNLRSKMSLRRFVGRELSFDTVYLPSGKIPDILDCDRSFPGKHIKLYTPLLYGNSSHLKFFIYRLEEIETFEVLHGLNGGTAEEHSFHEELSRQFKEKYLGCRYSSYCRGYQHHLRQ